MTEAPESTPEDVAKSEHADCHWRWSLLSPEQRQGMTFHGWEAHLPTTGRLTDA